MNSTNEFLTIYRKKLGLTQKQLGMHFGLSETTVQQIENGKRPVPHKLKHVQTKLLIKTQSAPLERRDISPSGSQKGIQKNKAIHSTALQRDLPILGHAQGGTDGNIIMNDTAIDWTMRPANLRGVRAAFAVFITGDSMMPKYHEGDLVYVHPELQPHRGKYVLVELKGHKGFIKQFIKWSENELVLKQFNPEEEIRISKEEVLHVKLIVGQKGR
jgi:phage repressor protein C with HTH and peptisase S24 domain